MLAVIKRVVDNNIICLLATQLMHAPVLVARNTVQQMLRITLNFISPELWSQRARAEHLGVYTRKNMSFKSTKLKKPCSDWLNCGKAVIHEKMQFSCFRILPGSAEALVIGEVET